MRARGFKRWLAVGALAVGGLGAGCGTRADQGNKEGLSAQERAEAERQRQQRAERVLRPTYNGTIRDIPESAQGRLVLPQGASINTDAYHASTTADPRAGGTHPTTPAASGQGAAGAPQGRPGDSGQGYTPRDPAQAGSAVQSPAGSTGGAPAGSTTPGRGVSGEGQARQDPGSGGAGTEGKMDDFKTPESQHGPEGADKKH